MKKYTEYIKVKAGTLEISEKSFLDGLDGITNSGDLISKLPYGVSVYWNYVENVYDYPQGSVPTNRGRADYIRYCFSEFDNEGFKSILLNPINDEHPALENITKLKVCEYKQ